MGSSKYSKLSVEELEKINLEEEVKVPYIIKDKTLVSPGVWNDFTFSEEAIRNSFPQIDWEDDEITSFYYDHKDRESSQWLGQIKNPRLTKNGEIRGDVVVIDKNFAMDVEYGAKFGISPRFKLMHDDDGVVQEFRVANFSGVVDPAIKTNYINFQKQEQSETVKMLKEIKQTLENFQAEENKEEKQMPEDNEEQSKEAPKEEASKKEVPEIDLDALADKVAERLKPKAKESEEEEEESKEDKPAEKEEPAVDKEKDELKEAVENMQQKIDKLESKLKEPETEVETSDVNMSQSKPVASTSRFASTLSDGDKGMISFLQGRLNY